MWEIAEKKSIAPALARAFPHGLAFAFQAFEWLQPDTVLKNDSENFSSLPVTYTGQNSERGKNRLFSLCNKLKVYNSAGLEMGTRLSPNPDSKLSGLLSKWAVLSNSSFNYFSIETFMSVVFSSFFHQYPTVLCVCCVTESLGVAVDKRQMSFLQSLLASFVQILISSTFSKGLVSNSWVLWLHLDMEK